MAQVKNRRKSLATLVVGGLTLAGTGVAFAYWTSDGDGSGSATTGVSEAFEIDSEPAVGDPLTPGGPSQTVAFTVTNPSTATLLLNSVTVRVANADGTTWDPAGDCSAADFTATVTTPPATGPVAGSGTRTGTATISMIETGLNQDSCQDIDDVPLYFSTSQLV